MIAKKVPEIRFKGFSVELEEKKLDIIVDIIDGDRGHNYPKENELQKDGHTLFLSASNVTLNGFKFDDKKYITKIKSNDMGNGKLEINDIALTSRGSLGHIAWYSKEVQQKIPFARINSGMLILRTKELVEPSFINQFLKSPLGKKKIDLISLGSAQPQLTKKDVSKYKFTFPKERLEQTKIGNYFQQLDKLIEQKQIKQQKLKQFKKAMLDKMFPKNGANTPEIRFKGFGVEWEEEELGNIVDFHKGTGLSKTKLSKEGSSCILYGELFTTYSRKIDKVVSKTNFMEGVKSIKNDILMPSSTTTTGIDLAIASALHLDNILLGGDINILRIKIKNVDSDFLANYLTYGKTRQIAEKTQGTTIIHLYGKSLIDLIIYIPNIKEQTKIGNYFKKLDYQIDLQLQELEKLKNIKKASLDKMFV